MARPDRHSRSFGGALLELVQGDITTQQVEAIVNAANPDLTPGGGVSGAIHRAGGPALTQAAAKLRKLRGPLATGDAVLTVAGELPARYVIHTVGPVWQGGQRGESELLAQAYRSCLALAVAEEVRSIAFPSISTGIYGFPVESAACLALRTAVEFLTSPSCALDVVRFVLFSAGDLEIYAQALEESARG